jgi:hypothetical protein
LNWKTLFIALHGMYSVILNALKTVLESDITAGQSNQNEGYKKSAAEMTHE